MHDSVPVQPDGSISRAIQLCLKRILLDLPLASMALLLLSPLLVGVGLAIRLTSKGPALFAQRRVGLNGRTFRMLKFRTFRLDDCDETGLRQVPGMRAAGVDCRKVVPYYDYRHRVRPGLSGWAQGNGLRGPTGDLAAARQRIDYDCAYLQNFSLGLDVQIIIRTIAHESLTGSGS